MSAFNKVVAGTVLGAGVIAGYKYIQRLRNSKAELVIVPGAKLHSLSWEGLIIKVDVLLKNPAKGSFSIKFPFVKLNYKGSTVGSSQSVNKDIKIPAYGEARIDNILVNIPVTSVFSLVFGLIKSLHNKEPVKMNIVTVTTIDIGLAKIPFSNDTEVILKQ